MFCFVLFCFPFMLRYIFISLKKHTSVGENSIRFLRLMNDWQCCSTFPASKAHRIILLYYRYYFYVIFFFLLFYCCSYCSFFLFFYKFCKSSITSIIFALQKKNVISRKIKRVLSFNTKSWIFSVFCMFYDLFYLI